MFRRSLSQSEEENLKSRIISHDLNAPSIIKNHEIELRIMCIG
jgi:hypothetical protein